MLGLSQYLLAHVLVFTMLVITVRERLTGHLVVRNGI